MKLYLKDPIIESKEKLDEKDFINLLEKLKDSFIKLNTFFSHLKVQHGKNFNKKLFWESEEVKKEIENLKIFFTGYIKYFSKDSFFQYAKDNKFEIDISKFYEDYNRVVSFYVVGKEFSFFFFEIGISKNKLYFYFREIVEIIFELFGVKFKTGKIPEKVYNLNDLIELIDNVFSSLNLEKYNKYNFKYNKFTKKYYKFIGLADENNFINLFSSLKEKEIISDFHIFQTTENSNYLKVGYPISLYPFAKLKLKTGKEIGIIGFFIPDRKGNQKQFFAIETSEIDNEIIDFIDQTYFVVKDLIIKNTEKQLIENLKFNFDTGDFLDSVTYRNRLLKLYLEEKGKLKETIKLTFSRKKKEEVLNYVEDLKNKYKNKRLRTEIDYFLTGDFNILKNSRKFYWRNKEELNFLIKEIIEYDARIVCANKDIDFYKYFGENLLIDLTFNYGTFENDKIKILKAYIDKITKDYEKINLEILFDEITPKFHNLYIKNEFFMEKVFKIIKENGKLDLIYSLYEFKKIVFIKDDCFFYKLNSVMHFLTKEYGERIILDRLYTEFKTRVEKLTVDEKDFKAMKVISKVIGSYSKLGEFLDFFRTNNPILSKTGTIIKNHIFDCLCGDKTKLNFVKRLASVKIFEGTEYYKIATFLGEIDENKFSLEEIIKSLAFSDLPSNSNIIKEFVNKNFDLVKKIFIEKLSLVAFDYYIDSEVIVDFYKGFFGITKEEIKQLKSIYNSNKNLVSYILAGNYDKFLKEIEERKKLFASGQLYPNKVKAEKYQILTDSLVVFKLLDKLNIDYQKYLLDVSNLVASGSFANINGLEKFLERYFPLDIEFDDKYIGAKNYLGYEEFQNLKKDFVKEIGKQKYDLICLDINKIEVSNHNGFYDSFIALSIYGSRVIETWRQNYEKIIKKLKEIKQTNFKVELEKSYSECIDKNTDNVLKILDWINKKHDQIVSNKIKSIYISNYWGIRIYKDGEIFISIDASLEDIEIKKYDQDWNSYKDYEKTCQLTELLNKLDFLKE